MPRKPLDPSHRKNRERSRRDLWKHHLSHNVLPSKVEASVVHTSRLKSSCLRCAPAVEDTVSCNGRQRRGTKLMEKVVRSKVVFTTITKRHHMGSVKRKRKACSNYEKKYKFSPVSNSSSRRGKRCCGGTSSCGSKRLQRMQLLPLVLLLGLLKNSKVATGRLRERIKYRS